MYKEPPYLILVLGSWTYLCERVSGHFGNLVGRISLRFNRATSSYLQIFDFDPKMAYESLLVVPPIFYFTKQNRGLDT